ncbi:immunoglobulin-like and fibronectin type III domain-containing protein 1 isoform 2-T2 [Salvelinus alpinus]
MEHSGRQALQQQVHHFRVYAKKDMGISAPSESPTWGRTFVVNMPAYKTCDLRTTPSFLVPLRQHTAPKGYEWYMCHKGKSQASRHLVPQQHQPNTKYLITICGVCSLLIVRVTPKDWGEYTIQIEGALGRAECSTKLSQR